MGYTEVPVAKAITTSSPEVALVVAVATAATISVITTNILFQAGYLDKPLMAFCHAADDIGNRVSQAPTRVKNFVLQRNNSPKEPR